MKRFFCTHMLRTAMLLFQGLRIPSEVTLTMITKAAKIRVAAFAMALGLGGAWAQTEEDGFICGSQDLASSSLAKSADLPKITKVWSGTLKALVIRVSFSDAAYATTDSTINKTNAAINVNY